MGLRRWLDPPEVRARKQQLRAAGLHPGRGGLEGQELVMLRVEIIGNLGSDPEQRYTSEGVAMTSIRVAVNSRRRGADGEQVERTDWFRVRTMGSKAEYVQRFTKGQRVLVIGPGDR